MVRICKNLVFLYKNNFREMFWDVVKKTCGRQLLSAGLAKFWITNVSIANIAVDFFKSTPRCHCHRGARLHSVHIAAEIYVDFLYMTVTVAGKKCRIFNGHIHHFKEYFWIMSLPTHTSWQTFQEEITVLKWRKTIFIKVYNENRFTSLFEKKGSKR